MRGHTEKFKLKTMTGQDDDCFRSATIYHSGGVKHTVKCETDDFTTRYRSFHSRDAACDFARQFVSFDADLPERSDAEKRNEQKKQRLRDTMDNLL